MLNGKMQSSKTNIQVSHIFTIIGIISEFTLKLISDARSKVLGNLIFEMGVVP